MMRKLRNLLEGFIFKKVINFESLLFLPINEVKKNRTCFNTRNYSINLLQDIICELKTKNM